MYDVTTVSFFINRIVFKKEGKDQQTFRVFLTEVLDAMSGFYIADLYPSIKWLDSISGLGRKLKEMVKDSNRMLDPIIEEHMSRMTQGKTVEGLVDVLLKFHKDNLDDDTNHSFSLTLSSIKAIILVRNHQLCVQ